MYTLDTKFVRTLFVLLFDHQNSQEVYYTGNLPILVIGDRTNKNDMQNFLFNKLLNTCAIATPTKYVNLHHI